MGAPSNCHDFDVEDGVFDEKVSDSETGIFQYGARTELTVTTRLVC